MARKIQPRSKTPKPTPGQSSEDYWRERETRQRAANIHDEARFAARINDIFQSTQDSIQQEIESFYQRYADKEGIDITEARRRVSKIDMEKYERLAAQYVKAAHEGDRETAFSDEANEQMRLYNATMRINRLEMLKARCGIRVMDGYRRADQLINKALEERTYSEYYRLAGILGNTVQFNENMVRSIVNASYQNATWSQRLWNNQALLSERIGAQIAQGILTGKGSDVLARNIQKLTGQSTYNCQRLMRTEIRRVQTAAAEQSMRDNGVTAYKFLVANGVNPCDECVALDGQVFKISEMEIGKNAPPKHPSCHCCTCPALDEEKWQRWLDGPAQNGVPWAEFESKDSSSSYDNTMVTRGQHQYSMRANASIINDVMVGIRKAIGTFDEKFEINKKQIRQCGLVPLNSLRKVDQELLAISCDQLEILNNRFNAIPQGIMIFKHDRRTPDIAYVTIDNGILAVSNYYCNKNEFLGKMKEAINKGHFMPCKMDDDTILRYTITHEYGHIFHNMMYETVKRYGYSKSKNDFLEMCYNDIIAIAKKNNPAFDYLNSISEYGRKNNNRAEFFAECFANSQLGKPNDLGIAMTEWLKQKGF